jgi:hypothetical protein
VSVIEGNTRRGWAARMRTIEEQSSLTPDDRRSMPNRIAAAEVARAVAADPRRGLEARLATIEQTDVSVPTALLSGNIVSSDEEFVVGATVLLCPSGLTTTSGGSGAYSFAEAPIGALTIKAAKTGVGSGSVNRTITGNTVGVMVTFNAPYVLPACP